jgi:hypothetical protein
VVVTPFATGTVVPLKATVCGRPLALPVTESGAQYGFLPSLAKRSRRCAKPSCRYAAASVGQESPETVIKFAINAVGMKLVTVTVCGGWLCRSPAQETRGWLERAQAKRRRAIRENPANKLSMRSGVKHERAR